jgi:hypothetical protein
MEMTLSKWSSLSLDERKAWLEDQSPRKLTELLGMLEEMLMSADDMDGQLALLIEPSEVVTNARNYTVNTLRDVEKHIVNELLGRQPLLARTV